MEMAMSWVLYLELAKLNLLLGKVGFGGGTLGKDSLFKYGKLRWVRFMEGLYIMALPSVLFMEKDWEEKE